MRIRSAERPDRSSRRSPVDRAEEPGAYVCTICCASKRRDTALLPAIERYLSDRIAFVRAEAYRLHLPLVILSGKFGLVEMQQEIPWYDRQLLPGDVCALVPNVVRQLARTGVRALLFYAQPRSTPGWEPYYEVLERACTLADIPLRVEILAPELY